MIADEIKTLIASGDLNARDEEGMTSLMRAVVDKESLASIKTLIAAGADVNARDTQGNTALIHAVLVSDAPDVVKALVDAGSDVNTRGNTGKRPIDLLDERSDKDTFAGSAAYWAMRKLLY